MLMTLNGIRELGSEYQTPLSDHSLSPICLLWACVAYDNDNQGVAIGPFDLVLFLTSQKLNFLKLYIFKWGIHSGVEWGYNYPPTA